MYESLWCFLLVLVGAELSEGFTPSASAAGVGAGVSSNMVDRTWDPVEPSGVASYYPGPRPWAPPAAGPVHSPPNFGVSLPPVTAPSCWSTPSIAGAAAISVLALGAILATKLPLILLAPAVLTLIALPLALPLLAPVLALAFMLPMPTDDSPAENASMAGMLKPPDDPKKPSTGEGSDPSKPGRRLWDTMNDGGQQCLQKVACQLGRHAGNTGMWVVKKLPVSEWGVFQEAYLEGSRNNNQSDNACEKFQCNAKGAFQAMSAATANALPGTL